MTGLWTGTPAVLVPTMSERESSARPVAALGAAEILLPIENKSGKKKWVDPDRLREIVVRVLDDPEYTRNAEAMGRKMRSYGGAVEAANSIEARLCR